MLQMEKMQKLAWLVNTLLVGFVIPMTGFYAYHGVTYMVYHSIPTIAMYIIFYFMIHKKWLDLYVWLVYAVIIIYMLAATICLGYDCGFHLYCMSLIPLIFYTEYIAHNLHTRKPRALPISIALICIYLISTGYVVMNGPVYEINKKVTYLCLVINAVSVFLFLIGYTSFLIKMVLDSEAKLSDMAHKDKLTGLFNRHYMFTHLDNLKQDITSEQWAAMVDIDDFKNINDQYGHGGGDYVLIQLCEIMQDVCKDCVISRWGGEEFLITANGKMQDQNILEKLRQAVEQRQFTYQGKEIRVTITIGTACYQSGQSLDRWIQNADNKLYEGKNSGKNRVVYS